ncbi:hypothetical protein DOY81_009075 [Sarcophaga bullata]|nr:hypothetical protein DOY81_009075 [Sarcophaga bullata]
MALDTNDSENPLGKGKYTSRVLNLSVNFILVFDYEYEPTLVRQVRSPYGDSYDLDLYDGFEPELYRQARSPQVRQVRSPYGDSYDLDLYDGFEPELYRQARSPQGGNLNVGVTKDDFGRHANVDYTHNLYSSSDGRGSIDAYAQASLTPTFKLPPCGDLTGRSNTGSSLKSKSKLLPYKRCSYKSSNSIGDAEAVKMKQAAIKKTYFKENILILIFLLNFYHNRICSLLEYGSSKELFLSI